MPKRKLDPEERVRALEALLRMMKRRDSIRAFTFFQKLDGSLTTNQFDAERPPLPLVVTTAPLYALVCARSEQEARSFLAGSVDDVVLVEDRDDGLGVIWHKEYHDSLAPDLPPSQTEPFSWMKDGIRGPAVVTTCAPQGRAFFFRLAISTETVFDLFSKRGCEAGDECRQHHEIRRLTLAEAQMVNLEAVDGEIVYPCSKIMLQA